MVFDQNMKLYVGILLSCLAWHASAQKTLISDVPQYLDLTNPEHDYIFPLNNYDWDQLEPHMDSDGVLAHHWGITDQYRRDLNNALKEFKANEPENVFAKESILTIIRNLDKVPEKYRTNIKNNGGGFINHCFYWGCMSPPDNITQKEPEGTLKADIEREFGSVESFKEKFTEAAATLFGSGYVWLSRTPASKGSRLVLHTTMNQDCPLTDNLFPLLVIDVWEHSYYLKHQFRRVDYIPEWWNLVDWAHVDKLDKWWQETFPKEMTRKDEL